jgi:hypothetical protein
MTTKKSYFHDHYVLFLLTVNVFLAIFTAIFVFIRLSSINGSSYIVQYRPTLGVSAFKTGNITDMISFGIFALFIMIIGFFLSLRVYSINRQLSITVLSFGILLLVLDIIISNALIVLH